MNNQQGGIISNIFLIPLGVALMVGFFFLGYYVGKYQSKSGMQEAMVPPLPELVAQNIPKKEEFTFYKTLTDSENRIVSIELKPKQDEEPIRDRRHDQKEKKPERKPEKPRGAAQPEPGPKQTPVKEPASNAKIRYTLQIASYQEKEAAEEDVKKMKQRGYAAFVVRSDIEGKGTWFRVRLGSFSSRTSAEKLEKELRAKEGIPVFITVE